MRLTSGKDFFAFESPRKVERISMEKLAITVACYPYDRVRALIDGTVLIEGCRTIVLPLRAEEVIHRAHGHVEFEVSELSMSSYIIMNTRGSSPYVAVPVFLSRVFRHSAIYVRKDRGIKEPSDLRSKLVGVPEYQMTAALWVRGMLSDIYGMRSEEIRWRTGGLEIAGRLEKFGLTFSAPFDVAAVPSDKTLSGMLADGELDALVSARAPSCFGKANSPVVRLFPDFERIDDECSTAAKSAFRPQLPNRSWPITAR
jgi:4,5-dihydroxyphthalate decarboxylase